MANFKSVTVIVLGMLAVSAYAESCLFNSTHCSCSQNGAAGTCYRHTSGPQNNGLCTADSCQGGGYVCDCLGDSVCERKACGAWRALDKVSPAPATGTPNVPCAFENDGICLEKVEVPAEYKMVQLGPKRADLMWNMTFQTDVGDYLTKTFAEGKGKSMHGRWPMQDKLKPRQLNVRLYKGEADPSKMFVCTIINTWGVANDGLGNYKVDAEITGLNGQTLSFDTCDDWNGLKMAGECKAPLAGPKLTTKHHGLSTLSDGWCAGPLEMNGNAVSIKYTNVQNMEGINFMGSDGESSEFVFLDSDAGLTGKMTPEGNVVDGEIPEIIIKPSGILFDV